MAAPKVLRLVSGVPTELTAVTTSTADGLVALDGSGKLNVNMLPTGIGADIAVIEASENLAAGDFVNIHNSTGAKVRKADATTSGKEAHGFVLAAVTSGQNADVYFEGTNDQVTSQTPGRVYLSTTPGVATATPPSGSGNVVQQLGVATATDAINVEPGQHYVLA